MEAIGLFIAFILTLMVFSYIFGDNALFKLAGHIFVGVAVGYAIVIIWYQVLAPELQDLSQALLSPTENSVGILLATVPALLLCALLLLKISPRQSSLANVLGSLPLAFVLGVGAALAIGGALLGTLMPQISATVALSLNPNHFTETDEWAVALEWLSHFIMIIGTVGTFAYFTFAVRATGPLGGLREVIVRFWAGMGRVMIIITLAALFANTVSSRVALLVSRLQFLTGFWGG